MVNSVGCQAKEQKINHNAVVVVEDWRPSIVIDCLTRRSPPPWRRSVFAFAASSRVLCLWIVSLLIVFIYLAPAC
jgi:hypothetical protein